MRLRPGDLVTTPSGKPALIVGAVNKRRIKVMLLSTIPNPGPRYLAEPAPIGVIYRRKDLSK